MKRGDTFEYPHSGSTWRSTPGEAHERRGVGKEQAERRAWTAVNRHTGGGNGPGGSGRGEKDTSAQSMTHAEWIRSAN